MRVKKSDIVKALEITGKFVSKSKTALKVATVALVDAPGQRVVATDLEAFCEVATPFSHFTKTVEKKADLVPIPGEDLVGELEGLKVAQLEDLANDYGIEAAGKKKKDLVEAIFKASVASAEKENATKLTEKVFVHESFCIDPALLLGVVRSLEDKDEEYIDIQVTEFHQGLDGEMIPASISVGSHFELLRVLEAPPQDFPMMPACENPRPLGSFNPTLMGWVAAASGGKNEELPTYRLCIRIESDGMMVASDGSRLHAGQGDLLGFSGMVPASPTRKICKIAKGKPVESWTAGADVDKWIGFSPESGVTVMVRLMEGEFPNFKSILEAATEHELSVKIAEITPALKQAALLTTQDYPGADLTFNGAIDIEVDNLERGVYRRMSVPVTGSVDPAVPMRLKVDFLVEAVHGIGEKAKLSLTDGDHPLHVCSEDGKMHAIVMPMRI